ncbi:MAG: chemotaxis protein CheW, partial [Myxococcota bacterium]
MTVSVDGAALGISIEQVDRITLAADVIPVPETIPEYLGLIAHDHAYVPLLALRPRAQREEELVVIVQVRGEPVGLSIDDTGRIYRDWTRVAAVASSAPAHGGVRFDGAATRGHV